MWCGRVCSQTIHAIIETMFLNMKVLFLGKVTNTVLFNQGAFRDSSMVQLKLGHQQTVLSIYCTSRNFRG